MPLRTAMNFPMPSCASVTTPSSTPLVGEDVRGWGSAGRKGFTIGSWLGLTAGDTGVGIIEMIVEGIGLASSSRSSMGSELWRLRTLAKRSDRNTKMKKKEGQKKTIENNTKERGCNKQNIKSKLHKYTQKY